MPCCKGRSKHSTSFLLVCVLSTMWFKAILWPLLYMVLLLVLVRVAKPAIAGWPDSLDDEDVNTPAMEWWKALELAAVVCKYPTACSYVSLLSMTVTAHQACGPQGLFIAACQQLQSLTEVRPQHKLESFRVISRKQLLLKRTWTLADRTFAIQGQSQSCCSS